MTGKNRRYRYCRFAVCDACLVLSERSESTAGEYLFDKRIYVYHRSKFEDLYWLSVGFWSSSSYSLLVDWGLRLLAFLSIMSCLSSFLSVHPELSVFTCLYLHTELSVFLPFCSCWVVCLLAFLSILSCLSSCLSVHAELCVYLFFCPSWIVGVVCLLAFLSVHSESNRQAHFCTIIEPGRLPFCQSLPFVLVSDNIEGTKIARKWNAYFLLYFFILFFGWRFRTPDSVEVLSLSDISTGMGRSLLFWT